ncbi:MAG: biotin/lipoyl-binding protein [Patescibacteria group bacterium]|nr:biotin/lipoyl-binding protein [Patescibacteria group bacterium]MDE1945589.1 biotin/lipoyl-binding protein [Patescibacteria group bacterium]
MTDPIHIIHRPKHVAVIAVTAAVVIGAIGAIIITRPPAYRFATAESGVIEVASGAGPVAETFILSFQASGQIESVSVRTGDAVKKGEMLAALDPENTAGALTQAKAAYAVAEANYAKLESGATPETVAVNETALAQANIALANALAGSLTAATNAVGNATDQFFTNPNTSLPQLSVAGVNFSNQNLQYKVQDERAAMNGTLASWQQDLVGATASSSGLSALAAESKTNLQSVGAYLDDLNTILTSFASGDASVAAADAGAVSAARAGVTAQISALSGAASGAAQAESALALVTSSARPEDMAAAEAQVTSAEGAVEIAQAAYDNRRLTAPADGRVTAVHVSAGQTAAAGAPAIEMSGTVSEKPVHVMVPAGSVILEDGVSYVLERTAHGVAKRQVTVGASDATNTEIVSGLSAGAQVVIQ